MVMTRGRKAALEKAVVDAGKAVTSADKAMVAAKKNLVASDAVNGKLAKGKITVKGVKAAQQKLKKVKKDHGVVVKTLKQVEKAARKVNAEGKKAMSEVVSSAKKAGKAKGKVAKQKAMQTLRKRRTSFQAAMKKMEYLKMRSMKLRKRAGELKVMYERFISKAKKANAGIKALNSKIKKMAKAPVKKMKPAAVKRTRRASNKK